ncbi:DNA repair protein RecO [Candidatus Collierbacteria bacterium RIFOXYB1_FULL_49_13]|uniref:DNA repair protein RecO n=1 Tax=Candidatus Collierbacteria bacterium RIFOXYB1_FULL_49_13 TaxID=1817728 RepID=A0A1F5FH91_9BACT|nr:MAG: DNA repair protein RecO [Candidatus Collierbacteria bacterium RIFOXYB1_FULL_49_13]
MIRHITDEGIVIRRFNRQEADRQLIIFTKNHGKISATAKGVRRPGSKKAGHLELFSHVQVELVNTHGYLTITQAASITTFPCLSSQLPLTRQAFIATEVLDRFTVFEENYTDLFLHYLEFLKRTNQADPASTDSHLSAFEVHLLQSLGFGLPETINPFTLKAFIESILDHPLRSTKV